MTMPIPLPHSIEAEQALLGAILINNDAYGVVAGGLDPGHFFEPYHQAIFSAMSAAVAAGRKATPITLKDALPPVDIAGMKMPVYLARLAAEATTIINAPDYAAHVRDLWELRQIAALGEDARSAKGLPADVLRALWGQLDDIRARTAGAEQRASIRDVARRVAEEATSPTVGGEVPSTGFLDIDRYLGGGYRPGRLIVLAGRPGMGKTAWAVSSARRAARRGAAVLIFSLEIDGREIGARMVSDELSHTHMPVQYSDILSGRLTDQQRAKVAEGAAHLADLAIDIDASGGLGMMEIAARARMRAEAWRKAGRRQGVVMIDYLGLVTPSDRYRGRKVDELAETAKACKELAKRLEVCVVLLAQLNRGVEGREDKKPTIADLRDSGGIEENADVVGLLYRQSYYDRRVNDPTPEQVETFYRRRHDLEVLLGKNRLGPTAVVKLFCDVANSAMDNFRSY